MAIIARPKRPGDKSLPAAEYNNLLRRVDNLERLFKEAGQRKGVPASLVPMQISAIAGDYLDCVRLFDGSTPTATVISVAKPFLLRRNLVSWNGLTFVYTSDQEKTASGAAGPDETWIVIPEYVVGDIIYAARVANGTGLTNIGGARIDWLDWNADARTWAEQA